MNTILVGILATEIKEYLRSMIYSRAALAMSGEHQIVWGPSTSKWPTPFYMVAFYFSVIMQLRVPTKKIITYDELHKEHIACSIPLHHISHATFTRILHL